MKSKAQTALQYSRSANKVLRKSMHVTDCLFLIVCDSVPFVRDGHRHHEEDSGDESHDHGEEGYYETLEMLITRS